MPSIGEIKKMYEVGQGRYSEYVKSIVQARRNAAAFLRVQGKTATTPILKNRKVIGMVLYDSSEKNFTWILRKQNDKLEYYYMYRNGKIGRKF